MIFHLLNLNSSNILGFLLQMYFMFNQNLPRSSDKYSNLIFYQDQVT